MNLIKSHSRNYIYRVIHLNLLLLKFIVNQLIKSFILKGKLRNSLICEKNINIKNKIHWKWKLNRLFYVFVKTQDSKDREIITFNLHINLMLRT